MKIKENDTVLIMSGKYRGKRGKVLISFPKENKILVEGINLKKKHQKPKKEGQKGQIVEKPAPIYVSCVKLICQKCASPVRVGYKINEKKKYRICKKCGQEI
ncbi:MAG: 50S ribosomal protein L24 [Parcubacteria group bacterium]